MVKEKIFIDGLMHLGDIIITSSAIREIKKMRPDSEITYFPRETCGMSCPCCRMPTISSLMIMSAREA